MNTIQRLKLNDEVIDGLCSFFKGANTLIENDPEFATLYAYLLLQATGIERLQKIIYILIYFTQHEKQVTDKELRDKLGHGIKTIHQEYLEKYFDENDKIYINQALQILTELVTVKNGYRYANFNLHDDEFFSIHDHIVKILKIDNLDYQNINDLIKISWKIVDIILKKYTSILVNLIWHQDVGNGEIIPICLQNYVTEGFQEINLKIEIKKILDYARKKGN